MSAAPSIFHPSSPEARALYDLTIGVIILCAAIFALVVGLIGVACFRFRARAHSAEPKPAYGNTRLESLWTLAPLTTLAVVMFFTIRTMIATSPSNASDRPDLVVIGHQWWWEIRYPLPRGSEAVTANEVHIPVGRRLLLELRSADVIHDFWVPELGRKIDAIPGHPNQIWLQADQARTYLGFCAEFCGASHAWMKIRVIAQNEDYFSHWLENQSGPSLTPVTVASDRGLELFRQRTCVNCHQITGVSTAVQIGPDLTHLGSRETLAAGALNNTTLNLQDWLRDPSKIKPGAHMPAFGMTKAEIQDLASYLGALK